jgi:hypothetical protein
MRQMQMQSVFSFALTFFFISNLSFWQADFTGLGRGTSIYQGLILGYLKGAKIRLVSVTIG